MEKNNTANEKGALHSKKKTILHGVLISSSLIFAIIIMLIGVFIGLSRFELGYFIGLILFIFIPVFVPASLIFVFYLIAVVKKTEMFAAAFKYIHTTFLIISIIYIFFSSIIFFATAVGFGRTATYFPSLSIIILVNNLTWFALSIVQFHFYGKIIVLPAIDKKQLV